jgi:hypothetical protein
LILIATARQPRTHNEIHTSYKNTVNAVGDALFSEVTMKISIDVDQSSVAHLLDSAQAFSDHFEVIVGEKLRRSVLASITEALGPSAIKTSVDLRVSGAGSITAARRDGGIRIDALTVSIDLVKPLTISEVELGGHLRPSTSVFGNVPQIKTKEMATRNRIAIKAYAIWVSSAIFDECGAPTDCRCPVEWLCPLNTYNSYLTRWGCAVCGKEYTCECQRGVQEALRKRVADGKYSYPDHVLRNTPYRTEICHLCRGIPSNVSYEHEMYGGSHVRRYYRPYIDAEMLVNGVDTKTAENMVRERLGVARIGEGWVNQTALFRLIKSLFPEEDVQLEASPEWLGRMRYDIFLPSRKLAIEYQGQQHFSPVSVFGGEHGFQRTVERDALKREASIAAGVILIDFLHSEEITPDLVRYRIERALPPSQMLPWSRVRR